MEVEWEKYGLDSNARFENIRFFSKLYSVEIHLRKIVSKNDEPTNRVMQAKQRVKLFEERKEKEQRWTDSFSTSYKIFIHSLSLSMFVAMKDESSLRATRLNHVASFDTFRLPIKRNSSIIEQRVVSPNYLSKLNLQLNYSKDVHWF